MVKIEEASESQRLPCLQLLSFILATSRDTIPSCSTYTTKLTIFATSDDYVTASWAMIALATLTRHLKYVKPEHSADWLDIWELCNRRISSNATCSASCYLLERILSLGLIPFSEALNFIDQMIIYVDTIGPFKVTESSIRLWRSILVKYKSVPSAHGRVDIPEQVCRWIFAKLHSCRLTAPGRLWKEASITSVCNLLLILAHHTPPSPSNLFTDRFDTSNILQFLYQYHKDKDVIDLLVFHGTIVAFDIPIQICEFQFVSPFTSVSNLIVESFSELLHNLPVKRDELNSNSDWFYIAMLVLAVLCRIHTQSPSKSRYVFTGHDSLTFTLLQNICSSLEEGGVDSDVINCIVMQLSQMQSIIDYQSTPDGLLKMLQRLLNALERPLFMDISGAENADTDMDDAEFGQVNNLNRSSRSHEFQDNVTNWHMVKLSWNVAKCQIIVLFQCSILRATAGVDVIEMILTYLGHLTPATFYLILPSLNQLLTDNLLPVDIPNIIDTLFRLVGERTLQKYQYERSEITMISCTQLLCTSMSLWLNSPRAQLDIGVAMYKWVTKVGIENGLASYLSRISIDSLLYKVICQSSLGLELPETSYLLSDLSNLDIRVQHNACILCATLVTQIQPSLHLELYNMVHENFATTYFEGQIISTFGTAKLASASPLIARDAIYHLVEFSNIPNMRQYVGFCFRTAAKEQELDKPERLFEAFLSQIYYSWCTSGRSIAELDFSVFGYQTRESCFESTFVELVAQSVVFYPEELTTNVVMISESFGNSNSDVFLESLGRVFAYSAAVSTGNGVSALLDQSDIMERMVKLAGNYQLLVEYLHQILPLAIAILLSCVDSATISKSSFDSVGLVDEAHIWRELNELSDLISQPYSAPLNQPYYDAVIILNAYISMQMLTDQARLKSRLKEYDTSTAAFIARVILNDLEQCINYVQRRSILRVLKLHITLSQENVKPYLVRICLHSIASLVTNQDCIAEVLDIAINLLSHQSLTCNPELFVRFVIQIMYNIQQVSNSVNNFLGARDFQYILMKFKTRLHSCVSTYATRSDYVAKSTVWLNSLIFYDSRTANGLIAWTATDIQQIVFTHSPHFDAMSRQYALKTFALELERASSQFDSKILTDSDCISLSSELLRLCSVQEMPDEFILWVSRICGRAYASSGKVLTEWADDVEIPSLISINRANDVKLPASFCALVGVMILLMDTANTDTTRRIEHALHDIVIFATNLDSQAASSHIDLNIPSFIREGIDYQLEDQYGGRTGRTLNPLPKDSSFDAWSRHAGCVVCSILVEDCEPFYKVLLELLDTAKDFAAPSFKYLMHAFVSSGRNSLEVTEIFNKCFRSICEDTTQHAILLIETFVFLQNQETSENSTVLERICCIDKLDFVAMIRAALFCEMYYAAYLICELMWVSGFNPNSLTRFLTEIYKGIDDPDALYGVDMVPTIQSAAAIAEFEHNGWKALSYKGALLETGLYGSHSSRSANMTDISGTLSMIGLNGLSLCLSSANINADTTEYEKFYESAWKLGQWDIHEVNSSMSKSSTIYHVLKNIAQPMSLDGNSHSLDSIVRSPSIDLVNKLTRGKTVVTAARAQDLLQTLAIISEAQEMWAITNPGDLLSLLETHRTRMRWADTTRYV